MNCENYGVLLSKYVDDELSTEERKTIDEHLGRCNSCRETLAIFLKNESILNRALAGEIFGSMVVNRVMSTVQTEKIVPMTRREEKTIHLPKMGSSMAWRIVASVAAVLLLAVTATSAYVIMNLQKTVATISDDYRANREAQDRAIAEYVKIIDATALSLDETRKRLDDAVVNTYAKNSSTTGLARVGDGYKGIRVVKNPSEFKNREKIDYYEILRIEEGSAKPVKLNNEPLAKPDYTDLTAQPGRAYIYHFLAFKNGSDMPVDSISTREIMTESGVDAKDIVEIRYLASSSVNEIVTIEVTKTFDGQTRTERFMTEPGELIGKPRYSAELQKELNFTTSLRLSAITTAEKFRTIFDEVIEKNSGDVPIYESNGLPRKRYEARIIGSGETGKKIVVVNEKSGLSCELWEGEAKKLQ